MEIFCLHQMEQHTKNTVNGAGNTVIFFEKDHQKKWVEHTFEPCAALKPYIKGYMILEFAENTVIETLPSTTFSLNYILRGSIRLTQPDGSKVKLPQAVSFGITKRFFEFTFSDFTTLFVVIFHPGFASAIIQKPLNEIFEKFVPMDEFFGAASNTALIEGLQREHSYEKMVDSVEQFLLQRISPDRLDRSIYDSISTIHAHKGLISISTIVAELPISRDTFEKRFRHLVGTSPKRYAGIIRFRNLFEQPLPAGDLTAMALRAGYYDQSHFIKDFKSNTGKLPSDCF